MDGSGAVPCAGALVAFVRECVQSHGANVDTPIFVREGADGPMRSIADVKMGIDPRGRYIVLETSPILVS